MMRTRVAPQPKAHRRPRLPFVLGAGLMMAIGFVLAVLGIIEIGGLMALGAGMLLIFIGSVLILLGTGNEAPLDEELRRILDER